MALGEKLAGRLPAGSVVALCGDLGSGKTTFVKGMASGLGIHPDKVSSPTFVLIREYRGGKRRLFHADLYRLEGADAVAGLGLEEYFPGGSYGGGIFVLEWAEKAGEFLPADHLMIDVSFAGREKRRFRITAGGNFDDAVFLGLKGKCGKRKK